VSTPWVYPPTPTPVWYYPTPTPVWYYSTPTPVWYYPTPTLPWYYLTPTPVWYYQTPTPIIYPPTWTPVPLPPTPLPPVVTVGVNPPTTQLSVGQSVALTADAVGQGLTFQWTAARGTLSSHNAPAVIYTAPASPGPDTVTVAVSNRGGTTYRSLSFTITYPTPAAPTPMPPLPGATPTPVVIIATPTSVPGTTAPAPPGPVTPEETLAGYYRAINARDYVAAWAMLSPRFKHAWHCCTPDGDPDFASFVRWWERVEQTLLRNVGLSGPIGDTALVQGEVAYRMLDGVEVVDPYPYTYLVRDTMTGAWQLTSRGPSAAIAGSPPPPAPDEAVRNYYAAAGARLYHIAWAALSSDFKAAEYCCTPTGDYDFDAYADWWDGVLRVEISAVRIVEQTDSGATVYADVAYLKKDGQWLFDAQSAIRLALDRDIPAWLFSSRTTADRPSEVPPIAGEPVEAVRRYYAAVAERNYGISWPMLSSHFKQQWHCCAADGSFDLAGYAEWWDSVQRLDVGHVELISRDGDRATVYAELVYTLRDGRQVRDTDAYIKLRLDPASGQWLFWDKSEAP
jgi:hypothetical protein